MARGGDSESYAAWQALKEKLLLSTKAGLTQHRSIQETFNSLLKSRQMGSCHMVSDGSGEKKGSLQSRARWELAGLQIVLKQLHY